MLVNGKEIVMDRKLIERIEKFIESNKKRDYIELGESNGEQVFNEAQRLIGKKAKYALDMIHNELVLVK